MIVQVRTRRKRQRIDNFGASGCWSADPIGAAWNEANNNCHADLPARVTRERAGRFLYNVRYDNRTSSTELSKRL
jgi:hypothetical protein